MAAPSPPTQLVFSLSSPTYIARDRPSALFPTIVDNNLHIFHCSVMKHYLIAALWATFFAAVVPTTPTATATAPAVLHKREITTVGFFSAGSQDGSTLCKAMVFTYDKLLMIVRGYRNIRNRGRHGWNLGQSIRTVCFEQLCLWILLCWNIHYEHNRDSLVRRPRPPKSKHNADCDMQWTS